MAPLECIAVSVIFFDVASLANLVAILPAGDVRKGAAVLLEAFSRANAAAYAHQYGEGPTPITAQEIDRQSKDRIGGDREDALTTAQLLSCNTRANDGTQFLSEAHVGLLEQLRAHVESEECFRSASRAAGPAAIGPRSAALVALLSLDKNSVATLVRRLAFILPTLEAELGEHGAEALRKHPVAILMVEKLATLLDYDRDKGIDDSFQQCLAIANFRKRDARAR